MPSVMDLTSLWKGALGTMLVICFWYLLISLRATVPGRHLWVFFSALTPPEAGADFFFPLTAEPLETPDWLETLEPVPVLVARLPATLFRGILKYLKIKLITFLTIPMNLYSGVLGFW